jgi:hypothetical protein
MNVQVGMMFFLVSLVYAAACPLAGWVSTCKARARADCVLACWLLHQIVLRHSTGASAPEMQMSIDVFLQYGVCTRVFNA